MVRRRAVRVDRDDRLVSSTLPATGAEGASTGHCES
jgi:hypothetical protein